MPTMPVLCLLFLYYAYYASTMPTMLTMPTMHIYNYRTEHSNHKHCMKYCQLWRKKFQKKCLLIAEKMREHSEKEQISEWILEKLEYQTVSMRQYASIARDVGVRGETKSNMVAETAHLIWPAP